MFVKVEFSPEKNPFTDLVKKQESFKIELYSENKDVTVIISHDLKRVEYCRKE